MVEKQPQKRPLRFSEEELSLLQSTFSDRQDLFVVIRKKFLQIELNEQDEKLLEIVTDEAVADVLKKVFFPEITGNEPVNEIIDLRMSIALKELDIEKGYIESSAREVLANYTEEFIWDLYEGVKKTIMFEDFKFVEGDESKTYENLYTRNTLLAHIEGRLHQIQILAGEKNETPEEKKERLQQDSTK